MNPIKYKNSSKPPPCSILVQEKKSRFEKDCTYKYSYYSFKVVWFEILCSVIFIFSVIAILVYSSYYTKKKQATLGCNDIQTNSTWGCRRGCVSSLGITIKNTVLWIVYANTALYARNLVTMRLSVLSYRYSYYKRHVIVPASRPAAEHIISIYMPRVENHFTLCHQEALKTAQKHNAQPLRAFLLRRWRRLLFQKYRDANTDRFFIRNCSECRCRLLALYIVAVPVHVAAVANVVRY